MGEASEVLNRSVKLLVGEPEHAIGAEVQADLPLCDEVLAAAALSFRTCLKRLRNLDALDWPR